MASAAEAVFESGFTGGFERFDAVRAKYRDEPWYKDLHGNYTHFILPYTEGELRERAKTLSSARHSATIPCPRFVLSKPRSCGFWEKTISKRRALRPVAALRR